MAPDFQKPIDDLVDIHSANWLQHVDQSLLDVVEVRIYEQAQVGQNGFCSFSLLNRLRHTLRPLKLLFSLCLVLQVLSHSPIVLVVVGKNA